MSYSIYSEPMKLREYGRNIQMMVGYCRKLEDRDERNALAREIVRIMGYMIPTPREGEDHQQKLWDHFFHLAEYDIDVDCEFPIPTADTIFTRPTERMAYQTRRARFKQYGLAVELMAEEAVAIKDDEDKKFALITLVLNIMKMQLRGGSNEKDSNAEATVCEHLRVMSKGLLDYKPESIKFHKFSSIPSLGLPGMPSMQQRPGAQQAKKKPGQMQQGFNPNINRNRK